MFLRPSKCMYGDQIFIGLSMIIETGRRSLVVRAAGTKSGGRGFKSRIGHDGDFSATGPNPG